jgi:hypothetical protein
MQGFYRFNETSGDIITDSTMKKRHGILETEDISKARSTGYEGKGIFLDGTSRVIIPEAVFSTITDAFTISIWINAGGGTINSVRFSAGDSDPNYWDKASWTNDSNDTSSDWVHYAFVKDSDSSLMRIYRNGLIIAHHGNAVQPINGMLSGVTYIGSYDTGDSNDCFVGNIDHIQIFNYALSQSEVLYTAAGSGSQIQQPILPYICPVDPHEDGIINFRDLAVLARQWMEVLGSNQ